MSTQTIQELEKLDREHRELVEAEAAPVTWTERFDEGGEALGLWVSNLYAINTYVWKEEEGHFTGWVDVYNPIEGIVRPTRGRHYDTLEAAQKNALVLAEIVITKTFEQLPDNCAVCDGTKGGTRGNENVIDGVVTCDYCTAEQLG